MAMASSCNKRIMTAFVEYKVDLSNNVILYINAIKSFSVIQAAMNTTEYPQISP